MAALTLRRQERHWQVQKNILALHRQVDVPSTPPGLYSAPRPFASGHRRSLNLPGMRWCARLFLPAALAGRPRRVCMVQRRSAAVGCVPDQNPPHLARQHSLCPHETNLPRALPYELLDLLAPQRGLVRVVHTPACYISYSTAEDSPSRPLREPPIYQHASLVPMKHVPAHPEGFPSMPTLAGAARAPRRLVPRAAPEAPAVPPPWRPPRSAGWAPVVLLRNRHSPSPLIPLPRHVCSILANEHGHQPHRIAQT